MRPAHGAALALALLGCREGTDEATTPPQTLSQTVTQTTTVTVTEPVTNTVVWDCFADDDGDGFGDPARPGPCETGWAANADDCDDTDTARGGGAEVPYTGRDEDCSGHTPDDDLDGDGFLLVVDCDDADPRVGGAEVPYDGFDNDCDPATPDDDLDGDGAGLLTDCDDGDASVGAAHDDADCDGLPTDDDCDDDDPLSTGRDDDADCDGLVAADDCDDGDPSQPSADADCDGLPTADDCDDTDPLATSRTDDADCDSVVTSDDCDDDDPALGAQADDRDCDAVIAADDCDDTDAAMGPVAADGDCDGVVTTDDCDDTDPDQGSTVDDLDCDGIANDDVREGDVTLLPATEIGSTFARAVAGRGQLDGDGLADLLVVDFNAGAPATLGEVYVLQGSEVAIRSGDHRIDEVASWVLTADTAAQVLDAKWVDDLDGDGADDLWVVVSELDGDSTGGALRIGSASLGPPGRVPLSAAASLVLDTTTHPDLAFDAAARVGDIDGDGMGEVLLSQPHIGLSGVGEVQVVMSTGVATGTPARHRLYGPTSTSDTGRGTMVGLGDLDGDGLADVAVGAREWGSDRQGQLYIALGDTIAATPDLWLGDADASFIGTHGNHEVGLSEVARVGDLDGDGLDDLLVGDYADERLVVVRGTDLAGWRTPLDDVATTTVTSQVGSLFGLQVDPVDDLDGDGLEEVAVSAPYDDTLGDDGGAIWVLAGADLAIPGSYEVDDLAVARRSADGAAGEEMAGVGDVDGDGVGDLLVSAPYSADGGSTALFWGAGLLP